ncbi:hypothetical protein [Pigmentiphaga sp.]|nr:hypothetical protein [Pigmentiphaga sp.]
MLSLPNPLAAVANVLTNPIGALTDPAGTLAGGSAPKPSPQEGDIL